MLTNENKLKGLIVLAAAVLSAIAGCGVSGGLLQRAGIANPSDVRMVIVQGAGYGHLPMSPEYPMQGPPAVIEDAISVKEFYQAINTPDGEHYTRDSRNNRLAFLTQNGRVIMFGFGGGRPVKGQGSDITAKHSSGEFHIALLRAIRSKKDRIIPLSGSTISRIKVKSGKQVAPANAQFPAIEKQWKDLLSCYSPMSLKGNELCSISDVHEYARRAPNYLEVDLPKPAEFNAVVTRPNKSWPPKYYAKGTFQNIRYDKVYALEGPVLDRAMFPNLDRFVRFAFVDSKTGDCMVTDPVDPRKIVPNKGQEITYGPDLFAELVSKIL